VSLHAVGEDAEYNPGGHYQKKLSQASTKTRRKWKAPVCRAFRRISHYATGGGGRVIPLDVLTCSPTNYALTSGDREGYNMITTSPSYYSTHKSVVFIYERHNYERAVSSDQRSLGNERELSSTQSASSRAQGSKSVETVIKLYKYCLSQHNGDAPIKRAS
jgi:hypothetical protein